MDAKQRYDWVDTPMTERKILWTVTDPRGLTISLVEDVWQNHVAYRPELALHLEQVRLAVQDPDAIYFDPTPACAGVAPVLAQLFIFTAEGQFVQQFSASNEGSGFGSKYRSVFKVFLPGASRVGTAEPA